MTSATASAYAGDVTTRDCHARLASDPNAQLIDVRTTAEWAYVGSPDLSALSKEPLRQEWQVFPSMTVDPAFAVRLANELAARGVAKDAPLFFLCRSGVRSKAAAIAMTEAGFSHCYNVSGGFEGPHDPAGHRGHVAGWKTDGLPWRQP